MASEDRNTTAVKLSDEAIEETMECPSIYVNKFAVMIGSVVRLTFMEQFKDGIHPRASVALNHQDAVKLYKLLQNSLKETEEEIEKAKEAFKEGQKNG